MSPPDARGRYSFLQDLLLVAAANVGVFYLIRYALARLEPEDEKTRKATSAAVLQRLEQIEDKKALKEGGTDADGKPRRTRKEDLQLNQYEQSIAAEVVAPEDIAVHFDGMRTVP